MLKNPLVRLDKGTKLMSNVSKLISNKENFNHLATVGVAV